MFEILKNAQTTAADVSDADLAQINGYSRRQLAADDVYTFRIRACDDQPDREFERFSVDCLQQLVPLYVGKTVILDHVNSALRQVARVYKAEVVAENGQHRLVLSAYIPRNEGTAQIIESIDTGILREVSVHVVVRSRKCSICGESYLCCTHWSGHEYNGETCVVILGDPVDAYEISFVAIPAQPAAGVEKSAAPKKIMTLAQINRAKSRLEIEKLRYGG